MTLNASGPLSMGGSTVGQSINLELGVSATAQGALNDTSFRTLAGVASGTISISNFYGKSNTVGNISYVVTTANISNRGTGSGVDSSGNFWTIANAQLNSAEGTINIQKWNSSNVFQSSKNYTTSATYPLTTVMSFDYEGGQQNVGYDGNLYTTGSQGGTLSGVSLLGNSNVKWDSTGTWVRGKTQYLYFTTYVDNPTYLIYFYSKAGSVNAAGVNYVSPVCLIYVISGYDCCGNPLYTSYTERNIGALNSSGDPISLYQQANVPGQAGTAADFWNVTTSGTTNYFCTSMQIPPGFATRISQRSNDAGSCNWSYTYKATYTGSYRYITNNAGSSCVVDNSGSLIAVDFDRYRIMKVNSSGTYQWGADYVFPAYTYELKSKSVAVDSSNNIYLVGECNNYNLSAAYPMRVAVVKINSSGVVQWGRVITSVATPAVTGTRLYLTSPTAQVRGSDLVITFTTPQATGSWGSTFTLTYPQSGSFTGNANVTIPGGSNYYTLNIATMSVTTESWTFDSVVTQSNSLSSSPFSQNTVTINQTTTTLTASTTSVNF